VPERTDEAFEADETVGRTRIYHHYDWVDVWIGKDDEDIEMHIVRAISNNLYGGTWWLVRREGQKREPYSGYQPNEEYEIRIGTDEEAEAHTEFKYQWWSQIQYTKSMEATRLRTTAHRQRISARRERQEQCKQIRVTEKELARWRRLERACQIAKETEQKHNRRALTQSNTAFKAQMEAIQWELDDQDETIWMPKRMAGLYDDQKEIVGFGQQKWEVPG
jgi:hypothetical protein